MATKQATIVADFTTNLATAIAVGGTSATLQSATDDDNIALPAGRYFFTIDGDNSSKEHISCDLSGTALTNIKTVARQGAETAGVLRSHRIGATVSLTDFAHILQINNLLNGTTNLNASTPLGYDGAPSITTGNQLATKTYVDGVALVSAPNMDLTTKGVSEEATAAEINAGTQTGGTSAELTVNPKYLKDSNYFLFLPTTTQKDALVGSGTPSSSNKFVTADTLAGTTHTIPSGSIQMYAGSSAPTDWLLCDGTSYVQATYAALFAIIGTTYGSADGTHFNVPDLRGRVPVGVGTGTGGGAAGTGLPTGGSALTAVARGTWKGEETHTLDTTEIPAHTHSVIATATGGGGGGGGSVQTSGNTGSTGGGLAHNNLQPVMGLNFIIKT